MSVVASKLLHVNQMNDVWNVCASWSSQLSREITEEQAEQGALSLPHGLRTSKSD